MLTLIQIMKSKFLFFLSALTIAFIFSCKKDNDNTVNGGYVDAYIHLNDPSAIQLNAIGGWIYYSGASGGLKGLIIFRKTLDDFAAYDRACTYHPNASCALVEVESNGAFAVDSCCNSKYNLYNMGVVEHGPATQALIQYRTSFDGSVVHVFN